MKMVTCMTDRPDGAGYLTMTTRAEHVRQFVLPETAESWQKVTGVSLWTPKSAEWRKVKIW